MSAGEILAAITGTGGALVVLAIGCALFISGKIVSGRMYNERAAELRQALADERSRADAAVLAAQVTNQVLAALHREVTGQ